MHVTWAPAGSLPVRPAQQSAASAVLRISAAVTPCDIQSLRPTSYCARFPHLLRRNLEAMGLSRGYVGAHPGYVVVDYEPMVAEGRSHHNSVALSDAAPPPTTALWKALLGRLDLQTGQRT